MELTEKIASLPSLLLEENKFKRRTALRELKQITSDALSNEAQDSLNLIWSKLEIALFSALSDQSEINRTEASIILIMFLENLTISEKSFSSLLSILHHRIGKIPIAEDSEEVKIELLGVLNLIVKRDVKVYCLSDIIDILALCLRERCPEIVFKSCECIHSLILVTKKIFQLQSGSLVTPLIKRLTHQRFKIRCQILETIGHVLINGNSAPFEKLPEPLGLCVKDIPQVRLQLVKLGLRFATEFSERYTYWQKIIPWILFGLRDCDNEVKTYAINCWLMVGEQYERENEDTDQDIKHYMPKKNVIEGERQYGIGCQILVQKSLHYLLPCINLSVDDWQLETRLRATQLLTALIVSGQESIVQYSDQIVEILCVAANDKEKEVRNEGFLACRYFGFFVSPKIYFPILEYRFNSVNAFEILLSIMSGTPADLLRENFSKILLLLEQKFTYSSDTFSSIVGIISLLASTCDVKLACKELLLPLLYYFSCAVSPDDEVCAEAITKLAEASGFVDVAEMMNAYSGAIMMEIEKSASQWDEHCHQFMIFMALSHFGVIVGNLDSVERICRSAMNRKDCPIVRYKLIESVQHCVTIGPKSVSGALENWIATFIGKYINPLLPWTAGNTAKAMRTAALGFLLSMTVPSEYSSVLCQALRTSVTYIPKLITDDSEETRYLTCKFIQQICKNSNINLDNKVLLSFTEILIRRLDDKKKNVRLIASETLPVTVTLDKTSIEEVKDEVVTHINSMLIYLDEDDAGVRQNVFDTLKRAGEICPQYLLEKLHETGHKYRNEDLCVQLADELSAFKIS